MDYNELIDGLRGAGHDVSGYAPPTAPDGGFSQSINPTPKKSPSAGSLTLAQLAGAIDEAIARYVEPFEARIKELEARPTLRYRGVWNASTQYVIGDFCTHDGSLWHCNVSTIGTKPSDTRDWQLAVKRGRDAQSRGRGSTEPRIA
jgi:hypothetical protein